MTHNIKLLEGFCNAVLCGEKCFEIRKNDRGYQKGDLIHFIPTTNSGVGFFHEVEKDVYEITYVLGGWGLQEGYVVFGIKKVKEQSDGTN